MDGIKYQSVSEIPAIAHTRLAVEKHILEHAHSVVATSPQERDDLETLVSRLGNIDIIPCGTDVSTFHPISKTEARKQLGISAKQKVVLYVGRFDKRKGIETLVRATGELRSQLDQGEEIAVVFFRIALNSGMPLALTNSSSRRSSLPQICHQIPSQ